MTAVLCGFGGSDLLAKQLVGVGEFLDFPLLDEAEEILYEHATVERLLAVFGNRVRPITRLHNSNVRYGSAHEIISVISV